MRKFTLLFIWGSLVATFAFGKTRSVDSLERLLANASGSTRVEILLQLSDSTLAAEPAKSLEYGLKALVASKYINSPLHEAASLMRMGLSSVKTKSYENGLRYFQRSIAIFERFGKWREYGRAYLIFGDLYAEQRNYNFAHEYYLQAVNVLQRIDKGSDLVEAYYKLGALSVEYGKLREAKKYAQLAYSTTYLMYRKDQRGMAVQMARTTILFASTQKLLGDYAGAKQSLMFAYEICKRNTNQQMLVMILIKMSNLVFAEQNYSLAKTYIDSALVLAEKSKIPYETALVYSNLGDIYFVQRNYPKAQQYYQRAATLFTKTNSYKDLVSTYVISSRILSTVGNNKEALRLLNLALYLSKQHKLNQTVADVYLSLSIVFERDGKYLQSLEFHKLWAEMRDSLYSDETGDKLARLQMLYEISQKDQENKILKQNAEIQKLQINRNKFQLLYLILGITVIISLFMILFVRYRSKNREVARQRENEQRISELNRNLEKRLVEELRKQEVQQELLAQKSKLESLGTLSAGIAHEINQPLGGISMGLDNIQLKLLEGHLTDDYLNRKIDGLFQHVERIKKIIEHTRTFSRSQRQVLFGKVDVNEVVNNALLMINAQLVSSKVELEVALGTINGYVLGDNYRLEQVVLNLLSNAKHALEDKEKKNIPGYVKCIKLQTYSEGDEVVIVVWDNGVGIPHENIDKIFDPFFTTKKEDKGTGLGLSITYGIVKDMLGELRVESEYGVSTRMKVILPISN